MRSTNRVKARLAAGETVCAMWADFGSPSVAEAAAMSGWDTILVDCEHGLAGIEGALDLIRAVEAAGAEAVLRVPEGSEAVLKRALDMGARSIMVPMVSSEAEARRVVELCRYPPRGRRGYAAPIARASRFGGWRGYAAEAHDDLLLIVQIEHADAVPAAAAIAAVEGVDMLFVGPNDLAASMGHLEALAAAPVLEAIARVEAAARDAGRLLGTITGEGRGWAELRRLGYRFVAGPNDVAILAAGARAAAAERDAALAPEGAEPA